MGERRPIDVDADVPARIGFGTRSRATVGELETDGRGDVTGIGTTMTGDTDGRDGLRRRQLLATMTTASVTAALAGCQTNVEETTTTGGEPTATATTATTTDNDTTETETAETTTTTDGDVPAGMDPCLPLGNRAPGPECNAPKKLDFNVTEDRTIGESCNQYVVDRPVTVRSGATLRVEPGTVVRFEQGTGIEVFDGGSLDVAGTCDAPVSFTGTADGRGHWGGIVFRGTAGNRLRYCVIENAGRQYADLLGDDERAAVMAGAGASLAVENCTVRQSSGYGVALGDDATLDRFRANVLTNNRLGAASARPATAAAYPPANRYDGNDADVIRVAPGAPLGSGQSVTWTDNGVAYRVGGEVAVDGDLTIARDVTLAFEPGAALSVRGGSLSAVGRENEPIVFTGTEEGWGHWRGIRLDSTGDGGEFEHCVVEYGGSDPHPGVGVRANLAVTGDSSVAVENCQLRESSGYALALDDSATLGSFSGNALTRNREGAAHLPSPSVPQLTADSSYSGNTNDVIDVRVTGPIPEGRTRTWPGVDAAYRVAGTLKLDGTLVVDPGATLAFTPRNSLQVTGGTLRADGTERDPITFTGSRPQPGIWQGILVESPSRETRLQHCRVEFAGGSPFENADRPACLTVLNGGRAAVRNCEFRRSNGFGLTLRERARVSAFEENVVTKNSRGAAYVRNRAVDVLSATSTYSGNDIDHVYVQVDERIPHGEGDTWAGIDVPYLVDDDLTVFGSLTVDPGATLRMVEDTGILVRSGGTFTAAGTEDDGIRITGTRSRRGHWKGIYFEQTGEETNDIRHAVIEFGGGEKFTHATAAANVAVTTESVATVTNSALNSSAGYGIHATRGTSVSLSSNTYSYNDLGTTDVED